MESQIFVVLVQSLPAVLLIQLLQLGGAERNWFCSFILHKKI